MPKIGREESILERSNRVGDDLHLSSNTIRMSLLCIYYVACDWTYLAFLLFVFGKDVFHWSDGTSFVNMYAEVKTEFN